jgi:hypothetical protein
MPYSDLEKEKVCQRNYRKNHKEKIQDYMRSYRQRPEVKKARREYLKKFIKTHPEEWRKIVQRSGKKRRDRLRNEIITLLGGKCSSPTCAVPNGMTDKRCLQIDHLNREAKHREKYHGQALNSSEAYLREVLTSIKSGKKNYQLLCANCNWIKRFENKEYTQPKNP